MNNQGEKILSRCERIFCDYFILYIASHCPIEVRSIIMPEAIDIAKRMSTIFSVSFLGLFVLNNTANATPEFMSNPEIIAPAERMLDV